MGIEVLMAKISVMVFWVMMPLISQFPIFL
jgi:hypothetical protein